MIRIAEALVVEGKYDKARLAEVVDTLILTTDGFGVFNDAERLALLRRLADARGIIVLTDPDGGGLVIRNFLKGSLPPARVKHAYIPGLPGKERRKRKAGKAGTLGVEGMERTVIEAALRRAGATLLDEPENQADGPATGGISKADLYDLGLSGKKESASRRLALQRRLELPQNLSCNALLAVLNVLYSRERLEAFIFDTPDCTADDTG